MKDNKPSAQQKNESIAMLTGMSTEYAFYVSLKESKTLRIMTLIAIALASGFAALLFYMADKV